MYGFEIRGVEHLNRYKAGHHNSNFGSHAPTKVPAPGGRLLVLCVMAGLNKHSLQVL